MNIKKITLQLTVTKHYEVEISDREGWDMPETPKELISLVNEYTSQPSKLIHDELKPYDATHEITDYEITEGK